MKLCDFSRWAAVGALCLAVAYVESAQADVLCKYNAYVFDAGAAFGGWDVSGPPYWDPSGIGYVDASTLFPMAMADGQHAFFGYEPTVGLGAACTGATTHVVLTVADYNQLRVANVEIVAKLQEGFELASVAVSIGGLLVGFLFGYRVSQRGSSQ